MSASSVKTQSPDVPAVIVKLFVSNVLVPVKVLFAANKATPELFEYKESPSFFVIKSLPSGASTDGSNNEVGRVVLNVFEPVKALVAFFIATSLMM